MEKVFNCKTLLPTIALAIDGALFISLIASFFVLPSAHGISTNENFLTALTSLCYPKVMYARLFIAAVLLIEIILLTFLLYNWLTSPGNTNLIVLYFLIINFVLSMLIWVYTQTFFYSSSNDCKQKFRLVYYLVLLWIIYVGLSILGLIGFVIYLSRKAE